MIITTIDRSYFTIFYSLLKGRKKPGRKKAIDSQQNKGLLEVLVNVHIPFLESSLHTKQMECDQS